MTNKKKRSVHTKDLSTDPGKYLQAVEKIDRDEESGKINYVELFRIRDKKKPH